MRTIGGLETKRHVLVDGNNLLHRTHYAFVQARKERGEAPLSNRSGFPTGLIYGFLSTLASWLHDIPNISDISVFLDGYSKRRKELDPSYKANRDSTDGPNLYSGLEHLSCTLQDGFQSSNELEILAHVLKLLGCNIYHHPTEEADDVIASFCKKYPETVRIIVSSDKDFFQLLQDPRVICYVPGHGKDRFFDAERSADYWKNLKSVGVRVPPTHVRMFKTLCGDSSDGVVGVKRLRKKVAIELCHHTSVDDVAAADLSGFSKSEHERFLESLDRLRTNYELVGFNESVDLGECLESEPADFALARRIVTEDLAITTIDTSPFRVGSNKMPVHAPLPIPDWLADL